MSYVMFLCSMCIGAILGICVGVELDSYRWGIAAACAAWLLTAWVDALAESISA
jgi:hypothetical protein